MPLRLWSMHHLSRNSCGLCNVDAGAPIQTYGFRLGWCLRALNLENHDAAPGGLSEPAPPAHRAFPQQQAMEPEDSSVAKGLLRVCLPSVSMRRSNLSGPEPSPHIHVPGRTDFRKIKPASSLARLCLLSQELSQNPRGIFQKSASCLLTAFFPWAWVSQSVK